MDEVPKERQERMTKAKAKTSKSADLAMPVGSKDDADLAKREAADLLDAVAAITINGPSDVDFVATSLREVKDQYKAIENKRKAATQPIDQALKEIRSWFKPALDALSSVEEQLKSKLAKYHDGLAEERANLLEDIHDADGDKGEQRAALVRLKDLEEENQPSGISYRDNYEIDVVDHTKVPREFMVVDMRALEAHIKAQPNPTKANIPGVVVRRSSTVVVR